MNPSRSFRALMDDLAAGREEAAKRVVEEYSQALVAVARRQIGPKLRRRVDAEDVVQSTYRSFFRRAGLGEFELGCGEALWRLLVTVMVNKIRRQGKFHQAKKRDVSKDVSANASESNNLAHLAQCNEPTPEEAAMLVDEVEAFLRSLQSRDREIVELRLQGLTSVEIAQKLERSERTVRRVLERASRRLSNDAVS